MKERLTEKECWDLLCRLFPNGLSDRALVDELAPEGWERSPLVRVFHPTVEQRRDELRLFREQLRRFQRVAGMSDDEPLVSEGGAPEEPDDPPVPLEECPDLFGRCLWDIFSDGHDVLTASGALVDLGSFRGAAEFIADFFNRTPGQEALSRFRKSYMDFYLGTIGIRRRTDLTPVYELIFRRMWEVGLDWRYAPPRLYLIDVGRLREPLKSDGEPETLPYDPTEHYWRERERDRREAWLTELRADLDQTYRESAEEAKANPPPPTVGAYRAVYGRWPDGWPPKPAAEP